MSIRAWISLRIGKDIAGLKKRGDVLFVKLTDSPVGEKEWKEFLIVDDWDDSDLEAELNRMRAGGEPHPVITHPYATYDETGDEPMLTRSTVAVDIDELADSEDVLNKDVAVSAKRRNQLTIRQR